MRGITVKKLSAWFIVGVIFVALSFVTFLVLSLFMSPFIAAAAVHPQWSIPIIILVFMVYTTVTGFLVIYVARKFGKRA